MAAAEEAVTATISRWRSAGYSSLALGAATNVTEATFTLLQALGLVEASSPMALQRACIMMVDYDNARALTVCPSLAAVAVASARDPDCARSLANYARLLWQSGGHCFSVLLALLSQESSEAFTASSVAMCLGEPPWDAAPLRLGFVKRALQTARAGDAKTLAWNLLHAVNSDWQRGGLLWDAISRTEQGLETWRLIQNQCHPWVQSGCCWQATPDCCATTLSLGSASTAVPHGEEPSDDSIPRTPSSTRSLSPLWREADAPAPVGVYYAALLCPTSPPPYDAVC